MKHAALPRAETAILIYLMTLVAGGALIASTLFWLMRPTVYVNPGLSAYKPPIADPIVPRVAQPDYRLQAASAATHAADRDNELMGFAAATGASPAAATAQPTPSSIASQQRTRGARVVRRAQAKPEREKPEPHWNPWPQRAWAYQPNDFNASFR
jgi:hypothetical protein